MLQSNTEKSDSSDLSKTKFTTHNYQRLSDEYIYIESSCEAKNVFISSVLYLFVAFFTSMFSTSLEAQMLQVLWVDQINGPICSGPLGPGPCGAVAQYMQRQGFGGQIQSPQTPSSVNSPPDIAPLETSLVSNSADGAIQCAQLLAQNRNLNTQTFLTCTRGALALSQDSATLLSCVEQANSDTNQLALCAGRNIIGAKLNQDQMKAIGCITQSGGQANVFASCVADGFASNHLSQDQQKVLNCAISTGGNTHQFGSCTAQQFFGNRLTPEAEVAITCAVQSGGNVQGFGGCAANHFLRLNLNPEQQIALQCVMSSGGQPYVAAGCTASQLTTRELQKCISDGIGGSRGCFGDNNDLVGRNGFVVRNIAALAGGPNSVIRDPGQILGGPNSVFNNPRQVLGGPNSAINAALRNVPSPPPIQLGKIGKHRVCIPWC